jgi:hypothetical protein
MNDVELIIELGREYVAKRRAELAARRKPVVIDTLPEVEPNTFDLGDIDDLSNGASERHKPEPTR